MPGELPQYRRTPVATNTAAVTVQPSSPLVPGNGLRPEFCEIAKTGETRLAGKPGFQRVVLRSRNQALLPQVATGAADRGVRPGWPSPGALTGAGPAAGPALLGAG